jgi:8-oxo-dGTP diphosphatase
VISVAVVVVIFTVRDESLDVLLIHRGAAPYEGMLALPGGLLLDGQHLDDAAVSRLQVETGVTDVYLEQLYTFDTPGNLERPAVPVTYFALVNAASVRLSSRSEWQAAWFPVRRMPELAFGNAAVVEYALERLQAKLAYTNVVYSLLPERFTLSQLQRVYETIVGKRLDKRNFRKRMLSLDIIRETEATLKEGAHRPARLYEFRSRAPERI